MGAATLAAAAGGVLIAQQSDSTAVADEQSSAQPGFAVMNAGQPAAENPWQGMPLKGMPNGVPDDAVRKVNLGTQTAWVAAVDDQVCVMATSAFGNSSFGSCGPVAPVLTDGGFAGGGPSPDMVRSGKLSKDTQELVGLVPDGVKSVSLRLSTRTVEAAVKSNLVSFKVDAKPLSYEYVDGSGQRHHKALLGGLDDIR